ncbi:MAG: hypothetical protein R2797_12855 [Gelidibacter sp.]
MMSKKNWPILKYAVPIVALMIIGVHFILVRTSNLNKWKGGGFGMYSEVHYYFNEVYINNLTEPLDSLIADDKNIGNLMMDVKRMPNKMNLKKMATVMSNYVTNDTVTIEVWKPLIDSKNSKYSRELINKYQFIKP